MKKRFGEKVCVANPFDKQSIDEAISNGYNVIYGSEMSKEEWGKVKENNLIQSLPNCATTIFIPPLTNSTFKSKLNNLLAIFFA